MKTTANPMKMPVRLTALRHLLPLLLLLLALPAARSQTMSPPGTMSFQGYLTDGNGNPLGATNVGPKNYTVVFRIWDSQTGGNELNAEQQTVTVNNGYFSILLGQGSAYAAEPHVASLSTLFTGSTASSRYVEMMVVGIGAAGANVTIAPRLQLVSSPYSYLAANAVNSVYANYLVNNNNTQVVTVTNGAVGVGTTSPGGVMEIDGIYSSPTLLKLNQAYPSWSTAAYFNAFRFISTATADGYGDGPFKQFNVGPGGVSIGYTNTPNYGSGDALYVNGNVGIATSNLTATLTVNGSANVSSVLTAGPTTISGNLSVSGAISGNGTIPVGGIIMWSGSISSIPAGWALCNGANGTPNLQDRFVVGAGNSYGVGSTGGSYPVTLSVNQLPVFSVSYKDSYYVEAYADPTPPAGYTTGSDQVSSSSGGRVSGSGNTDTDNQYIWWRQMTSNPVGGGQSFDNRPPYYALAFIMRVQ